MQTVRVLEKTGKDGVLNLRIPVGAPDVECEVVVMVESPTGPQPPPWGVPAMEILGIAAGNTSPPDDDMVDQWIREHRTEKYE